MIKLTRKLFFMPRYEWDTSSLPRLGYPVHLHQRTLAIMHHTVTLDSDFTKNVWETEQEIKEHMLLLQTIRVSDVGADIAYHDVAFFMADGSVIICEGRGIHRSGAHTRGYTDDVHNNVGGYAVAAAGDFHNIDININRDRVVELLEAQAEWLRSGGFYPTVHSATPEGTFDLRVHSGAESAPPVKSVGYDAFNLIRRIEEARREFSRPTINAKHMIMRMRDLAVESEILLPTLDDNDMEAVKAACLSMRPDFEKLRAVARKLEGKS